MQASLLGDHDTAEMDYDEYMASDDWKRKRRQVIERAQYRCERCGVSRRITPLDVHHKTYERFGCEFISDLEALCRNCHNAADAKRRTDSLKEAKDHTTAIVHRIEIDTGRNGFDSWAVVVLGDNWRDCYTFAEAIKHFTRSKAMPDPMKYNPLTATLFHDTMNTNRVQPD